MAPETIDKWIHLGSLAVTSNAAGLCDQRCPKCGAGLKLIFVAEALGKGSVCIACRSCDARNWVDGVAEVPPWVTEVGATLET